MTHSQSADLIQTNVSSSLALPAAVGQQLACETLIRLCKVSMSLQNFVKIGGAVSLLCC